MYKSKIAFRKWNDTSLTLVLFPTPTTFKWVKNNKIFCFFDLFHPGMGMTVFLALQLELIFFFKSTNEHTRIRTPLLPIAFSLIERKKTNSS